MLRASLAPYNTMEEAEYFIKYLDKAIKMLVQFMEKSLKEAQDEVVDQFSMFDEWLDKYEYLIDLGKNLEAYPESAKTDDKLIRGCQDQQIEKQDSPKHTRRVRYRQKIQKICMN